jgi:hypothetical protein
MSDQLSFDFTGDAPELPGLATESPALAKWREERRATMRALAQKLGLPLGKKVRVEFENGPPLEGVLHLDEDTLFLPHKRDTRLPLRIDSAIFHANEISSCVTLE